MEKVKDCPFCGNKIDIKSASYLIGFHCKECSADVVFTRLLKLCSDPEEVEKKSIELFNRRAEK